MASPKLEVSDIVAEYGVLDTIMRRRIMDTQKKYENWQCACMQMVSTFVRLDGTSRSAIRW